MLRRNLKHIRRYPSMSVQLAGLPIVFLLLFVYVFGETLGAGLGTPGGGRAEYLAYVVPGILLMTVASGPIGTSVAVSMDMTEGIIARFRTMAIARVSVLTGHVLGSMIQTAIGLSLVFAVAVALGLRVGPGLFGWLGVIGVLAMITFALTWLSVAFGLVSGGVESASNLPQPLALLPFLGSGFVPTESLPAGLKQFAEYQPFTPIIETVRALMTGAPVGNNLIVSTAWCAGIGLVGYLWSKKLFNREPTR